MKAFVCLIMLAMGSPVFAEDWRALDGAGVAKALTSRVLQYKDNAQQDFFADGRTLYQTRDSSWGKWRVDNDRYCSIWPPADGWACFSVSISDDGLRIQFTDSDGSNTDGKYIDLN
jgi:hypothetical protein